MTVATLISGALDVEGDIRPKYGVFCSGVHGAYSLVRGMEGL